MGDSYRRRRELEFRDSTRHYDSHNRSGRRVEPFRTSSTPRADDHFDKAADGRERRDSQGRSSHPATRTWLSEEYKASQGQSRDPRKFAAPDSSVSSEHDHGKGSANSERSGTNATLAGTPATSGRISGNNGFADKHWFPSPAKPGESQCSRESGEIDESAANLNPLFRRPQHPKNSTDSLHDPGDEIHSGGISLRTDQATGSRGTY